MPPEALEFFGSFITMDDPRHARQRGIVARSFTPRQLAGRARLGRDDLHRGHRRHVRAGRGRPRRGDLAAVPAAGHLRHDGHPPQRVRDRARRHQRDPRRRRSRDASAARSHRRPCFDAGMHAHHAHERAGRGAPQEPDRRPHLRAGAQRRAARTCSRPRRSPRSSSSSRWPATTPPAPPPASACTCSRQNPDQRKIWQDDLDGVTADRGRGDRAGGLAGHVHAPHRHPTTSRCPATTSTRATSSILFYGAANRDPRVFDDPETLRRPPRPEPARRLRRPRPALLPRRPPGPPRAGGRCSASCSPACPTSRSTGEPGPPRGAGRPARRRHQAPAGALHPDRAGRGAPEVARPTAMDEQFVHQIPELLPERRHATTRTGGRATSSSSTTRPATATSCSSRWPTTRRASTWTRCRWAGSAASRSSACTTGPYDGDPHTTEVPGARIEVVGRGRRSACWADPAVSRSASISPSPARTQPYGLRRGTMRAADDVVWDQCHILQSGTYTGTYTVGGDDARGRRVDRPARPLVGHPRPRPLPAVDVVPDPARRRLPRRVALGARRTAPASTPTAAGPAPTAATRSRSSTSTTSRPGSAPTATPAVYGEHGDDGRRARRHVRVHARRRPARSPSRPRAPSPAPTSRSTAAAST